MKKGLILFIFIFGLFLLIRYLEPYFSGADVLVSIPAGVNAEEIARLLKEKKLILSENLFIFLAEVKKIENKIKAGTYRLNPKMSSIQILRSLVKGKTYAFKITIPEGYTAKEIAHLLAEKNLVDKEKFLSLVEKKKLEGYLYPETYYLSPGMGEERIIEIMVKQFSAIFTPEMGKRAKELKLNREKIVILASIIEKEARKDEERKLISAVFHNRLRKNWALESCATVNYTWDKEFNQKKGRLTYKDLEIVSSYNTYRNYGLPPGAISNPGLDSINAALYPEETDAMFFVAKGEGTHQFSRYYQEHLNNQKRRKRGQKGK